MAGFSCGDFFVFAVALIYKAFSPAAAAVSLCLILAFLLLSSALVIFGVRSFVLLAVSYQVSASRRLLCTVTQTFHCI